MNEEQAMNPLRFCAAALAVVLVLLVAGSASAAGGTVIYDSIPVPFPGSFWSQGFECCQTDEVGDHISLGGTERSLTTVTVSLTDWACENDSTRATTDACVTSPGSGFNHDITFNIYAVDNSGSDPAVGSLIATKTQTFFIPYRPSHDSANCATGSGKSGAKSPADDVPYGGTWYDPVLDRCSHGYAFTIDFDFSLDGITLPDEIIYGVAYNTAHSGNTPSGVSGPHDSLNVSLATASPTVGTDVEPATMFWDTTDVSSFGYCDGGAGGTDTFRRDFNCWKSLPDVTSFTPVVRFSGPVEQCTATCYVDAVNGNDVYGGTSPTDAKKTIQAAVNQVDAGGTVFVLPGMYNESPKLNKSLTLQSTGGRDVTTIELKTPPAPTYLSALEVSGPVVTIDGFTILGYDAIGTGLASGNIALTPNADTVVIQNNLLKIGQVGTGTNGDDGFGLVSYYNTTVPPVIDSLTVLDNEFEPVNMANGGRRAFYINPGVNNFTFMRNHISGKFTRTATTQARNGLVEDNTVTGDGTSSGLGVWGYPDPNVWGHTTFRNNTILGVATAITLNDAENVLIEKNLLNGNERGVQMVLWTYSADSINASTIKINRNNLAGNSVAGIENADDSVLDGRCNWWGAADGPSPVGPGTGAAVSAGVKFTPWLLTPDLNGECTGPQPTLFIDDATEDMQGTSSFDVPVKLNSGASALSAVSFAVDWDLSCIAYSGVTDSLSDIDFDVTPTLNAALKRVTILIKPHQLSLPILPDGTLVTLAFDAAACDIPVGTGGTKVVNFSFPAGLYSFGDNEGQSVTGSANGGEVTLDFNDTPTNISLSPSAVLENKPAGETVGTFCTTDPDGGDCDDFAYSLVSSAQCPSSAGNANFKIDMGTNVLKTAVADLDREASGGYYHNICVRSTDGDGLWVERGFTVEVLNENERPVAVDDGIAPPLIALVGTPLAINVLANDTDPDGDTLTVGAVTNGAHGTVADNNTHVTYSALASPHYSGPDTFTYDASDGALSDQATVTVNVVANDNRGDCNADGKVDAADFPATVLEIFDADGGHLEWWLTYLPTFAGSPRGCDSNASENGPSGTAASVDAGDILCTVLIFFGNTNCTGSVSTAEALAPAELTIPAALDGAAGETIAVPVTLVTAGNNVAAAAFTLSFDPAAASFDPADGDGDGVPDAVTLNVPASMAKFVFFDAAANRIQIAVYGSALPMPLLSDGVLATVELQVKAGGSLTLAQASLGNDAGQSVPVTTGEGTIPLAGDGELFLPFLDQ
jgi:hypothetical protein